MHIVTERYQAKANSRAHILKGALDKYNIISKKKQNKTKQNETKLGIRLQAEFHVLDRFTSEEKGIFLTFSIFQSQLQLYTVQYPIGHYEDDAVHKIPHKVKKHWQNQMTKYSLDLI